MKNKIKALGFILCGIIWGNVIIAAYQQIYLPDPNWGVCWKQDHTLSEINSFHWRLTYGTGSTAQAPIDITPSCSGTQPFDCTANSKVPTALQVGTLHVKIEAANINSDGTLTNFSTQVESDLIFGVAKLPPAANHGSALGLKKLLESLMEFLFRPSH